MTATRKPAAGKPTSARKPPSARSRTFPPLPPARGRRSFAESWWGNAWVEALEGKQRSGDGRLARGRTYARAGNVGEITVTPGRVAARVQGSRRTPYRTSMDIPVLSERDWELLLDAAAGQAGHIAALLDRDMPAELAEDAARAGVRLLPRQSELTPSCSCPDWGYPCKHAAAVYYQVARLLDEDPFVLLLLRGRGEQELMDELQRRNAAQAALESTGGPDAPSATTSVLAKDVFAAARAGVPPLPGPPPAVDRAGPGAVLTGSGAPGTGPDPAALEFLAADAAARAVRLLTEALSPTHADTAPADPLDIDQDVIRLAAAETPPAIVTRLTGTAGLDPTDLARSVRAWQYGGPEGLRVLNQPWDPAPYDLAAARDAVKQAWEGERAPALRATRNRLTATGGLAQLRLGADHRWHPYRKESGTWWPAGPADLDPAAAFATALDPEPSSAFR
ncbi:MULTISPECIES: SWIM zinc finger family protein [unclassified Kitasatospora]|uniref:SWIM zinc finger family protein n=1 Tax=unclassified Kitasatospora TaxID=2633591 RepID=UPI0009E862DB|nr:MULTISPECIES: SWIM zinc finger family protein [unclassified Kitasatospora]